jgi:hypothetical protein
VLVKGLGLNRKFLKLETILHISSIWLGCQIIYRNYEKFQSSVQLEAGKVILQQYAIYCRLTVNC